MKRIPLKILALLLAVGVATVAFWLIPNFVTSEETEEYAVYSVLLDELFVKDGTKLLLIQNQTQSYEFPYNYEGINSDKRIQHMKKNFPFVGEDTLADFESKYLQPSKIKPNFNLPIKYVLIDKPPVESVLKDKTELENSNSETFTQRLFEKYPDARGVISLSRVGFNQGKTEAFVRVEFTHCGLCGSGDKVFLEKKSGVWTVKKVINLWVS